MRRSTSKQMNRLTWTAALIIGSNAWASSHREAPAIAEDPAADNTDVWAWVKPATHDQLYVIAAYNPLEEPAGGPNFHKFSDEVLYEVHITRGDSSLADVYTYQFRFDTAAPAHVDPSNLSAPPGGGKEFFLQLAAAAGGGFPPQTYSVTKIDWTSKPPKTTVIAQSVPVAPPNVGPRTFALVTKTQYPTTETSYDDAFAAQFITPMGTSGSEGSVWAGPRDDGFYVDLGGIFDLAGLRAQGVAQDGVAGFNCHAIVLTIPTINLTGTGKAPVAGVPGSASTNDPQTLGIWASASRKKVHVYRNDGTHDGHGPWVQVSRLGLPLVNEALIGLQDKDKYNRTQPTNDVTNFGAYFLNPVIVRDANFAGFYTCGGATPGPLCSFAPPPESNRTDILDVISLTNIPAANSHAITAIGDVLRVDMGFDPGFPNGRAIPGATGPNAARQEQANVTNVLLSLLLTKTSLSAVDDGVEYNDANYLTQMPWLAAPWNGASGGHGTTTP
jgi:hypothetical protein